MPRRTDLHKILLIGSGPIVIGQACEFDYSGTQACKALREEGYEVVLVNSNPATIMTDPGMADRTYIEPLTWEIVAKVIEAERPDALLPTLGGQTGLNLAMELRSQRRAREIRRRNDRRPGRRDRQGRGARAVQAGDGEDRPGSLPRRDGAQPGRRPRGAQGDRLAVRDPAQLHDGGQRLERRLQPRGIRLGRDARPGCLADQRGADRGIDRRLERIRNGGDARRRRQRRHHLLDREFRSDGRPHRRFDHRRPGPNAHATRNTSGCATRRWP